MRTQRLRLRALGMCIGLVVATAAAAQGASDSAAKLRHLHELLNISPDQEDAWGQYAAAMAHGADVGERRRAAEQLMPTLSTPRRLALVDATMTQELADFHSQSAAIERLYDHLSPNQQRTFDHETAPKADAGAGQRPDGPR